MLYGMALAVFANILFGVIFLYGVWLQPLNGTDVFAWRMVAMAAVMLLWLTVTGQRPMLFRQLAKIRGWKAWLLLVLPTPILASQFWLFMWAPANGHGLNVAMGYFLFPLMMIVAGRLFLGERWDSWQAAAVACATAGVLWELLRTGAFAWSTAWIAFTYPAYYLIWRQQRVPAVVGLTVDLLLIAPCVGWYLLTASDSLALITARPVLAAAVLSLGVFSVWAMQCNLQAGLQLPVALFGMMNYLEPVLLLVLAVLYLQEAVQPQMLPAYGLIWLGVCLAVWGAWRRGRKPVFKNL